MPLPQISGPIGVNVPSFGMTRSGMTVSANRNGTVSEKEIRDLFQVDRHPAGATLYKPGEGVDRVFLVKQGRVRLLRVARSGARSVVAILKVGDVFGGDPFRLEAAPADELAQAAEGTEIWSIDARDFRSQLEARPALAVDVFRAYADRVRSLHERVLGLTFKEVPARLAETILRLSEAHGEPCPHGGEVDLRGVTQQDLADLVGASRSFVSTLVNEMKREGLLGSVGRTMCVKDRRALEKIAAREK
jgi:CRP/FNR family cyclic AMP-dependent transcriptional regulator